MLEAALGAQNTASLVGTYVAITQRLVAAPARRLLDHLWCRRRAYNKASDRPTRMRHGIFRGYCHIDEERFPGFSSCVSKHAYGRPSYGAPFTQTRRRLHRSVPSSETSGGQTCTELVSRKGG